MSNPLVDLIGAIEALPDTFTKAQVKELCLLHLDGRRISCNYNPNKDEKHAIAYKLLTRGFNRKDAVSILISHFQVSKTWAYYLVNNALDRRYREINEVNIVSKKVVHHA